MQDNFTELNIPFNCQVQKMLPEKENIYEIHKIVMTYLPIDRILEHPDSAFCNYYENFQGPRISISASNQKGDKEIKVTHGGNWISYITDTDDLKPITTISENDRHNFSNWCSSIQGSLKEASSRECMHWKLSDNL